MQEEALVGLMYEEFGGRNNYKSLDYDKIRRFATSIQVLGGRTRRPSPARVAYARTHAHHSPADPRTRSMLADGSCGMRVSGGDAGDGG